MTAEAHTEVTIRRLDERDAAAVVKLAELDSGVVPPAPLLGIEVEGRLLAVASMQDGASIADPFSRTAELRALLELRATQLRSRPRAGRRRTARAPAASAIAPAGTATAGRLLSPQPRIP
jgi:hypothetical protein